MLLDFKPSIEGQQWGINMNIYTQNREMKQHKLENSNTVMQNQTSDLRKWREYQQNGTNSERNTISWSPEQQDKSGLRWRSS